MRIPAAVVLFGALILQPACHSKKDQGMVPAAKSLEDLRSQLVKVSGFVIPVDGGPLPANTEVLLIDLKDGDTTRVRPLEKTGAFGITSDACRDYLIECHVDGKPHWRDKFTAMCSSFQSTDIDIDLYRNIELGAPAKDRPSNPAFVADDNEAPPGGYDLGINTKGYNESAPVLSPNMHYLYFTSDRPLPGEAANGNISYRIYYSRLRTDRWEVSVPLSPASDPQQMKVCSITPDGSSGVVAIGGDLFTYELNGLMIGRRERFTTPINSEHWESHGMYAPDGSAFYFSSNRPGGFGGSDLYVCRRDASGAWGPATNLGHRVNTTGDESSAAFGPDGSQLWFCSSGLVGTGGSDVFRCTVEASHTDWSVPVDLNDSINTPFNETDIFISHDGQWAYFSSDRPGTGPRFTPTGQRRRIAAGATADNGRKARGPNAGGERSSPRPDGSDNDLQRRSTASIGERSGTTITSNHSQFQDSEVFITDNSTGRVFTASVDRATGRIEANLPPGEFTVEGVRQGRLEFSQTVSVPQGSGQGQRHVVLEGVRVGPGSANGPPERETPVADQTGRTGSQPTRGGNGNAQNGSNGNTGNNWNTGNAGNNGNASWNGNPNGDQNGSAGGDGNASGNNPNGTNDGSTDFQARVDLQQGEVAFYSPDTMDLGIEYMLYARMKRGITQDSTVFLSLVTTIVDQRSDIGLDAPGRIDFKYNKLDLSDRMEVQLTGAEEVFTIKPDKGNMPMKVGSSEFTDWIWRVKVRAGAEAGDHQLTFTVYGQDNDERAPRQKLARKYKVNVVIDQWHFFTSLWGAVREDPKWGASTLLIPLISFLGGIMARKRREKKAAAKKNDGKGEEEAEA